MKRGRESVKKFERTSSLIMASSPDDEAGLEAMKYRDLQKVAKENSIKANLPKAQLIQKILEAKSSKAAEDRVESPAAPSQKADSGIVEGQEKDVEEVKIRRGKRKRAPAGLRAAKLVKGKSASKSYLFMATPMCIVKTHFRTRYTRDPRSGAVGIVCQKPTYAHAVCPGASERHGDSCYDIYADEEGRQRQGRPDRAGLCTGRGRRHARGPGNGPPTQSSRRGGVCMYMNSVRQLSVAMLLILW